MTLLAVGVLMALIAFFATVFAEVVPEMGGLAIEKPEAYEFGAQQAASLTWLPLVLTVAVVGGEFSTSVWATSLTRNPNRVAHIGARLVIFTIASWLAFVFGAAVFAAIVAFAGAGSGGPEISEWLGYLWRFAAIALAWTSLGLGAVALMRSMVLALVATLGFSLVDSTVAVFVDAYEPFSLTAASTGLFEGGLLGGPFASLVPGADLTSGQSLAIVAGWTLFGILLTWWGLQRRDA